MTDAEKENVYNELLGSAKAISGQTNKQEVAKSLNTLVEKAVEALSSSGVGVLINTSRIFPKEDYYFAHCLNVCLLSAKIGMKKGYDKRRLKELALLGFTHAREHIMVPEDLLAWIDQDDEIKDIVKLADIYDTMTHPPSYRHETTASDTLMSILDADGFFNQEMVKMLLEELTLYPEGSWVELNSREIGKVVKLNADMPLRPVLEIVTGTRKIMDLSKNMLIYVVKSLTGEEVKKAEEKIKREEE